MKRRTSVRLALAWLTAVLSACWGEPKPCANIEKGERLQIDILGPHDKLDAGEELCSREWGLARGWPFREPLWSSEAMRSARLGFWTRPVLETGIGR